MKKLFVNTLCTWVGALVATAAVLASIFLLIKGACWLIDNKSLLLVTILIVLVWITRHVARSYCDKIMD